MPKRKRKNAEPFPQYEYTAEMHKEDLKLARITFHFRYKFLFQDSINYNHPSSYGHLTKDDFIQEALMDLMRFRPLHNPTIAKYSTWGRMIARRAMNRLYNSKAVKYTDEYLSMDTCPHRKNFDDDDKEADKSYAELIRNRTVNWANIMYYECVIDTALNTKYDGGKKMFIAGFHAHGYKQKDIAKHMEVSQAYVSKILKDYFVFATELFYDEDRVHNFYQSHFDEVMSYFDSHYIPCDDIPASRFYELKPNHYVAYRPTWWCAKEAEEVEQANKKDPEES